MIKVVKIKDLVYTNIEEKTINENGQEVWNIPTDLTKLKAIAVDTINWVAGDRVKKAVQNNITLLNASNSKAIVLLVKVINSLNPDTSNLSDNEKNAFNKMVALGDNGYADSKLLNNMLDSVVNNVTNISQKVSAVEKATTIDEVIDILNSL